MKEEIEEYKRELKEKGLHHASKEFKELVSAKEQELQSPAEPEPVQAVEREEEKKEVIKEKVSKKETQGYNPLKTYTFKMVKPVARWTVPREGRIWVAGENRWREIRYNKLAESPFVDEQDESIEMERIPPQFKDGELRVPGSNKALIDYLKVLPQFIEDPNKPDKKYSRYFFTLNDPEAKLKAQAEFEDRVLEAKMIISKAAREDAHKLAAFIRSTFNRSQAEFNVDDLKVYANSKAEKFPEKFIEDFNNPRHSIKHRIARGMENNVFTATKGKVKITKTNTIVHQFNPNDRFDDALTSWVMKGSDESKDFYNLLIDSEK